MILSLLLGVVAISFCLAFQAAALVYAVRLWEQRSQRTDRGKRLLNDFVQLSGLMACLMAGTVVQIMVWALLYRVIGAFGDFETAIYFSGVTFTTLGYGDVLLAGRLRFLAPLEAASGVMMFGLSTAALLSAVQRAVSRQVEHRNSLDMPRRPDRRDCGNG